MSKNEVSTYVNLRSQTGGKKGLREPREANGANLDQRGPTGANRGRTGANKDQHGPAGANGDRWPTGAASLP
jgi:hypothetical protein